MKTMALPKALPNSVLQTIDLYFSLFQSHEANFLDGLYLLGSLALDDFQEGSSDIDFAAVVNVPIDERIAETLAHLHTTIAAQDLPSFDGFYVERRRLDTAPGSETSTHFVVDGKFYRDVACFECNPAIWLLWSTQGITVLGPDPVTLDLVVDASELRRFQLQNLSTYWAGWIASVTEQVRQKSSDADVDAQVISWGVLGVGRIAYTLNTGQIASKSQSGEWLLRTSSDTDDATVIQSALAARRGEIHSVAKLQAQHALDFLKRTVASCQTGGN